MLHQATVLFLTFPSFQTNEGALATERDLNEQSLVRCRPDGLAHGGISHSGFTWVIVADWEDMAGVVDSRSNDSLALAICLE